MVSKYIDQGVAELVPGVLFVDEARPCYIILHSIIFYYIIYFMYYIILYHIVLFYIIHIGGRPLAHRYQLKLRVRRIDGLVVSVAHRRVFACHTLSNMDLLLHIIKYGLAVTHYQLWM